MKTVKEEKGFLDNVKGLLNESLENLDGRTQQRLENVRIQALNSAAQEHGGFFTPLRLAMVGGFTAIMVAAVGLFLWLPTPPILLPAKHIEDLEIITSGEHIDFYQDLDFYRWLATRKDSLKKGKTS